MANSSSNLQQKVYQAKLVIEDALVTYSPYKSVVAWSGGKDSTLLLSLVLEVCRENKLIPPVVLDIDQNDSFPELLEFRDRMVMNWDLNLVVVKNTDLLNHFSHFGDRVSVQDLDESNRQEIRKVGFEEEFVEWQPESPICNHLLKTVPISKFLKNNSIKAMYTGIRWDEHGSRGKETFISPRENPDHVRIHPLLHFSERDIWNATFELGVPYNDLYIKGYRSLDTLHGTKKTSDIPAWNQDLELSSERNGRSEDKEKMMTQLRTWGYM